MAHVYKLLYNLKSVEIPKEEVMKLTEGIDGDCVGACDAMFVAAIVYAESGASSTLFLSHNGQTKNQMTDDEIFKVWSLMSKQLSESATLGEGKKAFCKSVFETIRKAIVGIDHDKKIEVKGKNDASN